MTLADSIIPKQPDVAAPMSVGDARALTERIKEAAHGLCLLLLEAHDREAWRALAYSSWRAYATAEFRMGQSHAYRLLDQARVIRALESAANSPLGEIVSERDARAIKPNLDVGAAQLRADVEIGENPITATVKAIATARNGYSTSRRRQDQPSRIVERIAFEAATFSDDIAAVDFGAVDTSCVPSWLENLRKGEAALRGLIRRLERIDAASARGAA